VGLKVSFEGELTLTKDLTDFTEWDPSYVKLGEGKLVYFNSAKVRRHILYFLVQC